MAGKNQKSKKGDGLKLAFRSDAVQRAQYQGRGSQTTYRFPGHAGLILNVGRPRADGASTRTWYYIASATKDGNTKRHYEALGRYPDVTLAAAARAADLLRAEVRAGRDLAAERARAESGAARGDTIRGLCELYIERHVRRSLKGAREAERLLRKYVMPEIGDVATAALTRAQVSAMLETVVKEGPAHTRRKPQTRDAPRLRQADHVLARVRSLMRWSISEGLAESDPTVGVRKRRAGAQPRDRALNDDELAALWRALPTIYGDEKDPRAAIVKLLILTGCRKSEVLEAERGELHTNRADPVWIIPGGRTKNGRDHIVPLHGLAVILFRNALARADKIDPGGKIVFPSPKSTAAAGEPRAAFNGTAINAPLNAALRDRTLKIAEFVVHDIRRSVATGMARQGIERLVISKVLNHITTDRETVTGLVYDKHVYTLEKRAALKVWAVHVENLAHPSPPEKVARRRAQIKIAFMARDPIKTRLLGN